MNRCSGQSSSGWPPVLVVDDDEDSHVLAKRLIERAGIKNPVVVLSTVEDAKAFLRSCCPAAGGHRRFKPVAVLLDINIPGISGFRLLKWIRTKPALRKVKVFMLSSSDAPDDRAEASRLGADAYVLKFPSAHFVAEIFKCVHGVKTVPRTLRPGARPGESSE